MTRHDRTAEYHGILWEIVDESVDDLRGDVCYGQLIVPRAIGGIVVHPGELPADAPCWPTGYRLTAYELGAWEPDSVYLPAADTRADEDEERCDYYGRVDR